MVAGGTTHPRKGVFKQGQNTHLKMTAFEARQYSRPSHPSTSFTCSAPHCWVHGQATAYRCWGRVGAEWQPGLLRLTPPPPTGIRKVFLKKKNGIYQKGPNLEVEFRYTNFLLTSDPRQRSRSPLRRGLSVAQHRSSTGRTGTYLRTAPTDSWVTLSMRSGSRA